MHSGPGPFGGGGGATTNSGSVDKIVPNGGKGTATLKNGSGTWPVYCLVLLDLPCQSSRIQMKGSRQGRRGLLCMKSKW